MEQRPQQTTYSSLIPLDQYLVWRETKETSWYDGMRKLVGLGWEGGRLGEDVNGWEFKRLGVGLPAKLVERYEKRHRGVLNCDLAGVDKDKLSEGQLMKLVCFLESGAKVVSVPTDDGGTKLYVSVLSLGPNGVRSSIAVEQREKSDPTSGGGSRTGVEVKVNIFQTFSNSRKIKEQYLQLPPGVTFGPEPKPRISTRINRRAPDQNLKKKSRRERERMGRLAKKKLARDERLRRKEVLRDWLREWPCDDLPVVPALNKPKRDPTAHHCSEEVTAVVRRELGRLLQ